MSNVQPVPEPIRAEPPPAAEGPSYPSAEAPAAGKTVELAPGVHWLRMPLPLALNHINVWALAGTDGWTIVDTGLHSPETAAAWDEAFAGPLRAQAVERVICTHMHPDHIGMAGWLTRRWRCRFWVTRLEYLSCRSLVADTGRDAPEDGIRFYRAAGWNEDAIGNYRERFGSFGKGVHALPDSYHRIEDGEELVIGADRWRVIVGRGHSPEHACLYCPQQKLLISGDQVLPRISSNVSVYPTEPDADPLSEWIMSLRRVREQVPDEVLVLPAHGLPFRGLHSRIERLLAGHEQALSSLLDGLGSPRRAVDVFELLFSRPIRGSTLLGMATGEALAHLAWLLRRDLIRKSSDADGVDWYEAADGKAFPGIS